ITARRSAGRSTAASRRLPTTFERSAHLRHPRHPRHLRHPIMCAMKRLLFVAVSFLAWAIAPVATQTPAATVPELQFESVPDPLTLPNDIHLGAVAGVAVNSKGHVFVFSRGNI